MTDILGTIPAHGVRLYMSVNWQMELMWLVHSKIIRRGLKHAKGNN